MSICLAVFLFLHNNMSKHQWIFTKLSMCIDIKEAIGLGLLMGKFCQFLTKLSACHTVVLIIIFSEKIRLGILCELSSIIFSENYIKKKRPKCLLLHLFKG